MQEQSIRISPIPSQPTARLYFRRTDRRLRAGPVGRKLRRLAETPHQWERACSHSLLPEFWSRSPGSHRLRRVPAHVCISINPAVTTRVLRSATREARRSASPFRHTNPTERALEAAPPQSPFLPTVINPLSSDN